MNDLISSNSGDLIFIYFFAMKKEVEKLREINWRNIRNKQIDSIKKSIR